MMNDLEATFGMANEERRTVVARADSMNLPCPDGSIDAVVTSPPYLTRLDYAVATAPELAVFGIDWRGREGIRGCLMGTTTTARAREANPDDFPAGARRLFRRIATHPTKDSSGYYLKQFSQYFSDTTSLVAEIVRVLRPGGSAILVVQDSWYKSLKVNLGELFLEFFAAAGAVGEIVRSEPVRRHLTQLNRAAANYPKGTPEEHVLVIRKQGPRRARRRHQ